MDRERLLALLIRNAEPLMHDSAIVMIELGRVALLVGEGMEESESTVE